MGGFESGQMHRKLFSTIAVAGTLPKQRHVLVTHDTHYVIKCYSIVCFKGPFIYYVRTEGGRGVKFHAHAYVLLSWT